MNTSTSRDPRCRYFCWATPFLDVVTVHLVINLRKEVLSLAYPYRALLRIDTYQCSSRVPGTYRSRLLLAKLTLFSNSIKTTCACASSVEASVARSAGLGMILPRNLALGASTLWKRIRCKRGRCCSVRGYFFFRFGETSGFFIARSIVSSAF